MTVQSCASRLAIRPLGTGFACTVLVACLSSHPSVREVIDKSTPVICEKAKECMGAQFAIAYPGDVAECVTKTKAAAEKKLASDLEGTSACTDEEVDKCTQDLKAAACPASGLPEPPCNC